jgi:hypothetical protein
MDLLSQDLLGLIVAGVGVLANALSAILGRHINRDQRLEPLTVTVVSMGIGALVLLTVGILVQGLPRLNLAHWAIIFWLAVVNSAFAYTLWNHTLRTFTAVESSIIRNAPRRCQSRNQSACCSLEKLPAPFRLSGQLCGLAGKGLCQGTRPIPNRLFPRQHQGFGRRRLRRRCHRYGSRRGGRSRRPAAVPP